MNTDALELALALHQAPIQRFALRDRPLPQNIGAVLQLASAMQPQLEKAAKQFSESEETILEAVRFYLQQVLFEPGTDAYRILGLDSSASTKLIRQHHIWLQRWLHPDRRGDDWEAVLTTKVNWAWQQLRNESARMAYDQLRRESAKQVAGPGDSSAMVQAPAWSMAPVKRTARNRIRAFVIGALVAVCFGLFYLALTRQEIVEPDVLAQKSAVTKSPIRPRIPFAGDSNRSANGYTDVSSEGDDVTLLAGSSLKPPSEDVENKPDEPRDFGHDSDQTGFDSGQRVTLARAPAAASSELENKAIAEAPTTGIARKTGSGPMREAERHALVSSSQAASDLVVHEDAGRLAASSRNSLPAPSSSTAVTPNPEGKQAAVAIRAKRLRTGSTSAEQALAQVPAPDNAHQESRGKSARAPIPQLPPDRDVPKPQWSTERSEAGTELAQRATSAETAADPLNGIDLPDSAHRLAEKPSQDVTHQTLSRLELARERVRSMVDYFRNQEVEVSRWNDVQGWHSAERERQALNARSGHAEIDRFSLDPPVWRVSAAAVQLEATYHVDTSSASAESGQFFLDMAWRDGAWKIKRIEVAPAQ
jgi:curved DNA-binding protein CbpA